MPCASFTNHHRRARHHNAGSLARLRAADPGADADYPDVAVLEVAGAAGHPCVLVDAGWPEATDGFQVFGYPSEGGAEVIPLVGLLPRIAVGGRAGPGTGDQCRSCQKATHRLVPGLW